jgi:hypothetical protein
LKALLLLLITLAFGTGCGPVRVKVGPVELPSPFIEPLPAVVALRYTPELYTLDPWPPPEPPYSHSLRGLGQESVTALNRVFDAAFEKVIFLELSQPVDPSMVDVTGILELHIDHAHVRYGVTNIRYRADLLTKEGELVSSVELHGVAHRPSVAIRNASAAFLAGLQHSREIELWLARTRPSEEAAPDDPTAESPAENLP